MMDVAIQRSRQTFFPAFFPFPIFNQSFRDQWEYELFLPCYATWCHRPYMWCYPNWWDGDMSEVRMDKDRFVINLDVKSFSPEDLSVWVKDEYVEILGKHEERQDDCGYVAREFFRKYKVPMGVDPGSFISSLSSNGVLTICASRNVPDNPECGIQVSCVDKAAAPK